MSTPTFVAKRFLLGRNGEAVNTDYIVRIYVAENDQLIAVMSDGSYIELHTDGLVAGSLPTLPAVTFVGIG